MPRITVLKVININFKSDKMQCEPYSCDLILLVQSMESSSKFHYYTTSHEWIDFSGSVAYIGISSFKLKGLKEILKTEYLDTVATVTKGDIIAAIVTEGGNILVHMPVDGSISEVNTDFIHHPSKLLQPQKHSGWLFKIHPLAPYKREGLLLPQQYQLIKKR